MFAPGLKEVKIAIIGAGLTGLTLARTLLQFGFENVHVFERAPSYRANKSSFTNMVNIGPNGLKILRRLEPMLTKELELRGKLCKFMGYREEDGLLTVPTRGTGNVVPDCLMISRAQILEMMINYPLRGQIRDVSDRLPPGAPALRIPVHQGHHARALNSKEIMSQEVFNMGPARVPVNLRDPKADEESKKRGFVVNSTTRESLPYDLSDSVFNPTPAAQHDYSGLTSSYPHVQSSKQFPPNPNPPESPDADKARLGLHETPAIDKVQRFQRYLHVNFDHNVIDLESSERNGDLPPHIIRLHFEHGKVDDFHLAIGCDGQFSICRTKLTQPYEHNRGYLPVMDPTFPNVLMEGWAPASFVRAALGGHFPVDPDGEVYGTRSRDLIFLASIVATGPKSRVPTRMRVRNLASVPLEEARKFSNTDWVYWQAMTTLYRWNLTGFASPETPISPVYPTSPPPLPQDLAEHLFKQYSIPTVSEIVANSDPDLVTVGRYTHVLPFSHVPTSFTPNLVLAGQSWCPMHPASPLRDALSIEDAATLALCLLNSCFLNPVPLDYAVNYYDGLRSNRLRGHTVKTLTDFHLDQWTSFNILHGLQKRFGRELPAEHLRRMYDELHDYDVFDQFVSLADYV